MSEQENRNTLERYFRAFGRHDLDTIDALLHDDYVEEYPHQARGFVASRTQGRLPRTIPAAYRALLTTASSSAEILV
jgi:ketosteroid isomerase-like protein